MSSSSHNFKPPTDLLGVSEIKNPLAITWNRSGVNPAVGASEEDLWGVGGRQVFPAAPVVASVVSTSAADTSAGTGARTVRLYGLDASYNILTADVTLNGVTPVLTIVPFLRVTRLQTLTAGTTGSNEGTVTISMDGDPQARIQINDNLSHNINYTVPQDYWLIITHLTITVESGRDVLAKIFFRSPFITNNLWRNQYTHIVPTVVGRSPLPPLVFPPRTDFTVTVQKLSGAEGQASVLGTGYITKDPDVGTASNFINVEDGY